MSQFWLYFSQIVSLYLTILRKKSELLDVNSQLWEKKSELWDKKSQLPFIFYSVAETGFHTNQNVHAK